MDRAKEVLLEALKAGAGADQEQRLYRSGKLPGLFSARTSLHAEVAAHAVRDGLVEIVRTETRGKATVEWAKVTAKGVEYLLEQQSPLRALEDLRMELRANEEGMPNWLAEIRGRLEEVSRLLTEEVQVIARRLDQVAARTEEALRRVDKAGPAVPEGAAGHIPWAHDAATYLEKRRDEKCPLSELFAALKEKETALTIKDFHLGLRRLHDRGALRLLPFADEGGPPEPEYALLDGPVVYYYAAR